MAAVLKHWREAATLILVTSSKLARVGPKLTSADLKEDAPIPANNFDVLLLKRSSGSKFMPNLYVFPGGVAVDNDFSSGWISVFRKLGTNVQNALFQRLSEGSGKAPLFSRSRDQTYSAIPSEVAFRICAIRETFEESGVLLALPAEKSRNVTNLLFSKNDSLSLSLSSLYTEPGVINAWRKRVNEDPKEFLKMCIELDLIPEIWSLYEWSNWLTPARDHENSRRFDTAFFVCCVDDKPEAIEDAAETVNAVWASPSSLLSSYFEVQGGLAPPQVYELSRLINFESASQLLKFVAQPNRPRVERFLPCTILCKDYNLQLLPGDDLYPKQVDPISLQIVCEYEESLEELCQKYPNHHRVIVPRSGVVSPRSKSTFFAQCTMPPKHGHVYPFISGLDIIKRRSKL